MTSPAECAQMCVKQGMKYALVVGSKVYTLEGHEAELNKLAGEKVTVLWHLSPPMNDELRVENGTETLNSPLVRRILLEEFAFGVSTVAISSKPEMPEGDKPTTCRYHLKITNPPFGTVIRAALPLRDSTVTLELSCPPSDE